ncbi:MAG: hypothetical protein ACR2K3_07110 [Nocardioides sp.]
MTDIDNNGTIDAAPDLREDGDVTVLTHPDHGEFRLRTEASERPSYVAFRWIHRLPDDGRDRPTLVEFRIEPRDTGMRLAVAESGFSGLQKPRAEWLRTAPTTTPAGIRARRGPSLHRGPVKGWRARAWPRCSPPSVTTPGGRS